MFSNYEIYATLSSRVPGMANFKYAVHLILFTYFIRFSNFPFYRLICHSRGARRLSFFLIPFEMKVAEKTQILTEMNVFRFVLSE